MSIDTTFLRRCIRGLALALDEIDKHQETDDVLYDVFRAACVKEFELVLEQSGKLLRKRLAAFFASNRQADQLAFKDLFRHAARHGLIDPETVERWLQLPRQPERHRAQLRRGLCRSHPEAAALLRRGREGAG